MSKAQRDKGLRGELEVRHLFEDAGWTVKSLEGGGDNLALSPNGLVALHIETKRQERLQIDLWSHQAEAETPPGVKPLVVYRRSREPWRATLLLCDLFDLLEGDGHE